MTEREIIERALARLAKPENWTRGCYVSDGKQVLALRDPRGTCFCLAGAILHDSPAFDVDFDARQRVLYRVRDVIVNLNTKYSAQAKMASIAGFNDDESTTHKDILHVLNLARESFL